MPIVIGDLRRLEVIDEQVGSVAAVGRLAGGPGRHVAT